MSSERFAHYLNWRCLLEDPVVERCWGRVQEPLIASEEGSKLVERMISAGNGCVMDELLSELTTPAALEPLNGLRAAACVATNGSLRSSMT